MQAVVAQRQLAQTWYMVEASRARFRFPDIQPLPLHINARDPGTYTGAGYQRIFAAAGRFFQPDVEKRPGFWSKAGGDGYPGIVCGFPRSFYDEDGNFLRRDWISGERYLEAEDTVIDWTQPWTVYAVCFAGETSDDLLRISPDIVLPNDQRQSQFRIAIEGRGNGAIYVGGQGGGEVCGYGNSVSTNPDHLNLGYDTRRRFGLCVVYSAPGIALYNHHNSLIDESGQFALSPFAMDSKLRLLDGGLGGEGLVLHELSLATVAEDATARDAELARLRSEWDIS